MRTLFFAAIGLAVAACGQSETVPANPAPAPAAAAEAAPSPAVPAFDPAALNSRCMAVARRTDADPEVIAADQRICDCLERALAPAEFNTLIGFMEIDSARPDYNARVAELYHSHGMSENQFATEINRIRGKGRECRR
jgi:hypothetical protein